MQINWEIIKGVVERWFAWGIAYAVTKRWIPDALAPDLVILGGVILQSLWGVKVNTQSAIIQAAAAMSEVSKVETTLTKDQAAAISAPDAKVTTKSKD